MPFASIACLIAFGWFAGAQEPLPIQGLRVPLERYPNGVVRRQLHAERASMSQTGPIRAKGVRVETFAADGALEMVVEADECVYDREAGVVKSTGPVAARGQGMVLTGTGFEWNVNEEQIRVFADVRLEFNRKIANRKTER